MITHADARMLTVLEDLELLLEEERGTGDELTDEAYQKAKVLLGSIVDLPRPCLAAFCGGVIAEWQGNHLNVRLRCNGDDKDYIYYRSGNESAIERPASAENLAARVRWFAGIQATKTSD